MSNTSAPSDAPPPYQAGNDTGCNPQDPPPKYEPPKGPHGYSQPPYPPQGIWSKLPHLLMYNMGTHCSYIFLRERERDFHSNALYFMNTWSLHINGMISWFFILHSYWNAHVFDIHSLSVSICIKRLWPCSISRTIVKHEVSMYLYIKLKLQKYDIKQESIHKYIIYFYSFLTWCEPC